MSSAPFSYSVVARDIPADGRSYRLEPDEDERKALAEAFAVPEVLAVAADIRVRPAGGQAFSVRGTVSGTVVQTCVVTLEPFQQDVHEEIDVTLMRAEDAAPGGRRRDVLVDALDSEGPEVFHNGRIDLGAIVGEHLALGLDPYPHAPGAEFSGHLEDADPAESPFAALAAIKNRAS